eukprot:6512537-Pyramimonas_sp.AAC.1
MLKTTRPPSVKLSPVSQPQAHAWYRRLRRDARPALPTGLGVRHGETIHMAEQGGGPPPQPLA